MEITEVRFRRIPPDGWRHHEHPLHAVCSVTFDHVFVVHEVKVVGMAHPFLAMPCRKSYSWCPHCNEHKNQYGACYCGGCGKPIPTEAPIDKEGRVVAHYDMAHPVDADFRRHLNFVVLGVVFSGMVVG